MAAVFCLGNQAGAVAQSGKTGVIVVDVQGDFTTWKKGSLAVPGTDEAFVKSV
ncbi:MAG: amidase, partial [Deltaproteobacteria bacterium]|nr:amidase [Deltaproteobacteria bacterium]MBW2083941.1 amidase [Deltaproteobacteria bacterium]